MKTTYKELAETIVAFMPTDETKQADWIEFMLKEKTDIK